MSHDQKPSRVRVLDAGTATPVRRRGDRAPVVVDGKPVGGAGRRGSGIARMLMFLVGSAVGGAGFVWLGIARP